MILSTKDYYTQFNKISEYTKQLKNTIRINKSNFKDFKTNFKDFKTIFKDFKTIFKDFKTIFKDFKTCKYYFKERQCTIITLIAKLLRIIEKSKKYFRN